MTSDGALAALQSDLRRLIDIHAADLNQVDVGSDRALGALARQLYVERRLRDRILPPDLFGEASWDLLLDLFANQMIGRPVSISSACLGSCVPATTALRNIGQLEARKVLQRRRVDGDGRRSNLLLTDAGLEMMRACLRRVALARSDQLRH